MRQLLEIAFVWVVEIGLEIAKARWHWVEAVVGDYDGLSVLQLGERFHVEAVVGLGVEALRGGDVGLVEDSLAGEKTDLRVVAALGNVIADLELVFLAAKLTCRFGGVVVRCCKEDLGAEGLHEGAPAFAWERRSQRADALRGDDGNALRVRNRG